MFTVRISIVMCEMEERREWHELDFVQKDLFSLEALLFFFFVLPGKFCINIFTKLYYIPI